MTDKMKRLLLTGLGILFALALAGSMVCCVNYSRRVDFFLTTSTGMTSLNLYVARLGPYINPHGGNSDSYEFVLPGGLTHIPANQIRQYFVNYKEQRSTFAASGAIDLQIDGAGCEIHVNLAGVDGQPFPANGIHRVRNCGLSQL